MEEAIVSLAIGRISDLLIHEAVFLNEVRDEVDRLKAELMRMQSFLKDADHKQEKDNRLRNRVAEIRDLAYNAEDVIDSFILIVANQAEGCQGIIKRFTSIFTKPCRLPKIGVEIKAIQTKLEDISKSLPAYQITGEVEGLISTSSLQQRLRRTYPHVKEVDVVSLEGIMKDVLDQLMTKDEEDRPHVVSIVGMGGIGKTTLAKQVYNHHDVKSCFDCFAWAFISQQCKPREVVHEVLIKVLSPSMEDRKLIDKLREHELIERLFDALKEKRYLVVLDDLWKTADWDSLKPASPRGKKGSKILITTRKKEVALFADSCKSPIELRLLTDDESWKLFSMKAFPKTKESAACSKELETLGREMVRKCGGLPLAIVVLGGFLATKKTQAQWEMVQKNIHAQLNKIQQEDHQNGAVNGILVLSYNDLPYFLKPCFLYLGHYPEDSEISKTELIQLWIAEGFISPSIMESETTLMEDVAEQFLQDLINRSLVQVGKRDSTGVGVRTCRIHDLLRDLCMKKAQEENFFVIMHPSMEENNANFADVTLSASLPRRVAIHSSARLKGKCPNLRSLIFFQGVEFIECKKFKFLRVLKLYCKKSNELLGLNVPSEIGNLLHLRYLHLICYGYIILPRSVKKLKSLYTLVIRCFELKVPPDVLFKLECSRHVLLFNFDVSSPLLTFVRPSFTSKTIETLKYIAVEDLDEKNIVLSLKNIRSLGIRLYRSKDVETFLKAVIQFHRLRSLKMDLWGSIKSCPDLEPLSHCHHLSKLLLEGIIEEDPHSGHHHVLKFIPPNITKLILVDSRLMKQDPMTALERLPHLRILCLSQHSYLGTKLICSANGFLQLDSLEMHGLTNLEEWKIEEGAMPRLQNLSLFLIPNLKMFPEGLRYLTALQEINLNYMESSLVERIQVIDGRQGDDFSKVSHIPSIRIFHTMYTGPAR